MTCSFIVSCFHRPEVLATCLYSLRIQTHRDFEVIVTDNATDDAIAAEQQRIVEQVIADKRFSYHRARRVDCYDSANWGVAHAQGEYLCFPSDDGYYAPRFLELMLRNASADLIYCDCIWDGHGFYGPGNECIHLAVEPRVGKIDKGGFLLRRSKFVPFNGPVGVSRAADGELVEQVVRDGASHQKVSMVGWIHS